MADRSPTTRFLVRWLLYPLQALLIGSLYYAIRVLPLRWGTSIGSFLFRTIGQRMRVARVAAQNVRRVFPELNDREVKALLENIWDNLGRGACEFAHMDRFSYDGSDPRIEIAGRAFGSDAVRWPGRNSDLRTYRELGTWRQNFGGSSWCRWDKFTVAPTIRISTDCFVRRGITKTLSWCPKAVRARSICFVPCVKALISAP